MGGFTPDQTLTFLRSQVGAMISIGMLEALAVVVPEWEHRRATEPELQRLAKLPVAASTMSSLRRLARRASVPMALVVICVLATTIASTLAIAGPNSGFLDANVGSRVPVDYSADEVALKIPPLSPEIIDAIRGDRERAAEAGTPAGPAGQTPGSGAGQTPKPSTGVKPSATPTPLPTPSLPTSTPTLPVPTPTLPPIPTLPPVPTLPPLRPCLRSRQCRRCPRCHLFHRSAAAALAARFRLCRRDSVSRADALYLFSYFLPHPNRCIIRV